MAALFDKLKQGVNRGVTTVSVKSKEMLEGTKVKSQISDIQDKKKAALEELGNIAYTMFLKGEFNEERLRAKCAAIKGLDTQIGEKEDELREIHSRAELALGKPKPIAVCACGTEIHGGAKFCGTCGRETKVTAGTPNDNERPAV
jgi:NADH pyrophosphatase NudC (nudix superfamily)